jgi:hypothetical protein
MSRARARDIKNQNRVVRETREWRVVACIRGSGLPRIAFPLLPIARNALPTQILVLRHG